MIAVTSLARAFRVAQERARRERGGRAEERQRAYQVAKARNAGRSTQRMSSELAAYATWVRAQIEAFRPIEPSARVLEVGSGAHGLIFFLGLEHSTGVDPLADLYPSLFPEWQERAKTIRAYGEALPFEDASFDLVISDNVIDHAERPDAIMTEIARVLRPGGTLYFTVHVHHPLYAIASGIHGACTAMGIPYEIGPFADHTVHLTLARVRGLMADLPFEVLREVTGIEEAKGYAREMTPRHVGDRLKRFFFKNARYEIIATRR